MKKLLSLMLFTAFTTLTAQAWDSPEIVGDDACFIVSGAKWDHNNAFYRLSVSERTTRRHSFAGYSCYVFNSYTELKTHLATSRIERHSPIFVVQMAHGGMGGTAQLNAGTISVEETNREIRALSLNYKVAYLNQSCYGGELIPNKVNWDQANQGSSTIDRTCIMTDSILGRVSWSRDNLPRSQEAYNLEESYAKHPTGLLSSSAWSSVKLGELHYAQSQYPGHHLRRPEVIQNLYPLTSRFVQGMNSVIDQYAPRSSAYKSIVDNALLVLDVDTDDTTLRTLLKAPRGNTIQSLEPIRQAIFFPPASENACTQAVRKFIVSQWYIVFSVNNGDQWSMFQENLSTKLKDYPGLPEACSDLGESNKTSSDWISWLKPHSPISDLMEERTSGVASIEIKSGMEIPLLSSEQIFTKMGSIQSIIGREILVEETGNFTLGTIRTNVGYPNLGIPGATGNVLPAFNLASMKIPDYQNSLDERRRNACRSIQLKAW